MCIRDRESVVSSLLILFGSEAALSAALTPAQAAPLLVFCLLYTPCLLYTSNQLRIGGMERRAALVATGKTRMRPILMTTLTTVLAMLQVVFSGDMASQLMSGMAIVIICGLRDVYKRQTISSSNSLMNSESANYRQYVRWVKGGFTTLAGRCIVAFAEKDGHNYGLVILGCDTLDHLFTACDDRCV